MIREPDRSSIRARAEDWSRSRCLLDHIDASSHRGRLTNPTVSHIERNRLCGDEVRLELRLEGKRVQQARFEGRGCLVSQAAASMLCGFVEGRTVGELAALQAPDLLELLGVPLTPHRQQCALLAFRALKTLVYSLDESSGG